MDGQYRCKTLIVGAGLAGASLGFLLRKAGDDVLLLELLDAKEKDKLCGGLVSGEGIRQFEAVYGPNSFAILCSSRIDRICQRFSGCELGSQGNLWALPRKRLDDYALRRYRETDGRLMDRVAVREIDEAKGVAVGDDLRKGGRFSVRFDRLVGADGAMSATRRLTTGRAPRVAIAVESEIPLFGGEVVLDYLADAIGYSWYIPQGEKAVVGCGVCAEAGVDSIRIVREGATDFCRGMGIPVPSRFRGAPLPIGNDVLLRTGTRTFFIGDAAGLIHNITGAGIDCALLSVRFLANAFLRGDSYEETMRSCVEEVVRLSRDAKKTQFLTRFLIMRCHNKTKHEDRIS